MLRNYPSLAAAFYDRPLCLLPSKAMAIDGLLAARQAGQSMTADEVKLATDERRDDPPELVALDGTVQALDAPPSSGGSQFVAVLPLFGVMFQHGGMRMEASGGVSTAQFATQLEQLDASPAVPTIVIRAHTPGGEVWGTQELAETIRRIRRRKATRIVTAVDSQAASAGLWAGTATEHVYITPGGEMGSLGVLQVHQDVSGAEEQQGVKTTLIAVPERKVEGHPYAPLDDEVRDRITGEVRQTYDVMLGQIAKQRGVTPLQAEKRFGGGGMLGAQQAVENGLADTVASFRDALAAELAALKPTRQGRHKSANANLAQLKSLDTAQSIP